MSLKPDLRETEPFAVTKGLFDFPKMQWGYAKQAWKERDIPGTIFTGGLAIAETAVIFVAVPGAVLFDLTFTKAQIALEKKEDAAVRDPKDDII